MTTLSFDAVDADGSPRVFAGMHRRPFDEYTGRGGFIACTCGQILQTVPETREHWQAGHFDAAVYHQTPPEGASA